MHVYFSGIGGTGIGPLAMIASQAGYTVSGSDKQDSQYIQYLREHGINDIHIGQTTDNIQQTHRTNPIDWFVYSSAIEKENNQHPELLFVKDNSIKHSKRDEFINQIINNANLKLLAVAGTHGKTTTTAMLTYLIKNINEPISYSIGAKISFGDMGHFDPTSNFFALEADEFDRNFLSFNPFAAIISGISYDHHEIYPTQEDYNQAFVQFLSQSQNKFIWQADFDRLNVEADESFVILDNNNHELQHITLPGLVNKQNALLVATAVSRIFNKPLSELIDIINDFPGVSRRMEKLSHNLYTDYAHTTDKIVGALGIAKEIANANHQKLVIIYEPLTNRRMHHTIDEHHQIFDQVDKLYWVPSYLAREDPNQQILTPSELIQHLSEQAKPKAEPAELNQQLADKIQSHTASNDLVVALSGGGGHSLDEWLRQQFTKPKS
ncbi:hypothetical protein KC867_01395 [Candidatus Saccharibacteria bacterium]|nr:hypothetical protein [Candidatus Saccharibacteria bacterium]